MKTHRWTAAALLAATVLLHVAALLAILGMLAPKREKDAPSAAIDVVWVKTAPPPLVERAPAIARPRSTPRRLRPPPAVAARAADTPSAVPLTLPEEAAPASAKPVFDHQAALTAARKLANEKDPARAGTLSAALEARRELEETQDEKMGRTIASGKRSDCFGPNANGTLLTPLMWLFQKKGSGCKF